MTLRNQVLVWVGFTVIVILLIWLFRPILLPFVIGIALAYILNPAVVLVERAGIARAWSAAIVLPREDSFLESCRDAVTATPGVPQTTV